MEEERWQQIQSLFEQALEKKPDERQEFVRRSSGDDEEMFSEVLSLLSADESGNSMLDGFAVDAMDLSADLSYEGKHVGPYKILKQIGSGGMGLVFLAERDDGHFRQSVALKLIKRGMDSDEILSRFRSERQILARLDHPGIARLIDGGMSVEGLPYFTMEYVDGVPIDKYCDDNKLSIDDRLRLFAGACKAVQFAQRNLVVHRDLKPSNILVTTDGTVKLLDFGIAKVLGGEEEGREVAGLTRTGFRVLTPGYGSPEQVRGEPVTTASDVYSLGVVLFELLTGHRPYVVDGYSPPELERIVCSTDPDRPSTAVAKNEEFTSGGEKIAVTPESVSRARATQPDRLRKRLAGDLDNICLMALRKEPERRYPSAGQFLEDIDRHLTGMPVIARKDTLSYRTQKFLRRNRLAVTAAAIVVLVLAAMTVFYTIRLADERDLARLEADKAQQVANFLTSLFEASNPNESQGAELTARELLEAGAERIEVELADQPEVQASMLFVIGKTYHSLGLLEDAVEVLAYALEVNEDVHGPDDPEVARTCRLLGTAWHDLSQFDSAAVLYQRAYDIDRKQSGEHHPLVVTDLNYLGALYHDLGQFEEAEEYFRSSIRFGRKTPDLDSLELAHALNQLGHMISRQGRHDEAEPMLREGLEIRRSQLGPDHVEICASLGALAAVHRSRGDLDSAAGLLRESLAILQRLMGDDHHYVGGMANSLANVERDAGNYTAAESLYYWSKEVLERTLPPGHVNLAFPCTGLGMLLMATGRPSEAEPYLRRAVELRLTVLSDSHWQTAEARSLLGACLVDLRDFPEAETNLLSAYAVLNEEYGADHTFTQRTVNGLVALYEGWGREARASEYRTLLSE